MANRAWNDISPKVTAAAAAGALTSIVVFILFQVWGIALPDGVGAAITTILSLVAGYLIPDNKPAP